MLATPLRLGRRTALAFLLSSCAAGFPVPEGPLRPPSLADGEFIMSDGARLPYRTWLPQGTAGRDPWAVMLALHGFNDSRDAFEVPAPAFTAAGIALYAPDQRGFGAAPGRGFWAGTDRMAEDAATMARLLRARYPRARLALLGESMGGAILMRTATLPRPPPADAYVLCAPAVWGRAQMGILLSSGLWLVSTAAPWWKVTGQEVPIEIRASDNRAALIRLGRDPLTIFRTRFETLRGLTDAMDAAQAAAPRFTAPGLFLYGAHDQLVPPEATAALWRHLPRAERRAFYPNGYHLLLRDLDRTAPIGDIIAWLRTPTTPLPSGADLAAAAWLAGEA